MKPSLKREIGTFEATAFGVGIILGAGIYALIGPAAGLAGNSLWMSFVLGAVIGSFTGLSYAELSTMFPRAAAEYVYAKRATGNQFLAFVLGWLIVFAEVVAASTVAIGFAGYLRPFLYAPAPMIAIALIGLLSLVNFTGIKESSKVNVVFTGIEISGLALIIVLGMGRFPNVNYFESASGLQGVVAAGALVFFAYIGFEDIVNMAEETENPAKTIPRALILSIIVTTVLYVFVAISSVSLASWAELGRSEAPLAYAASRVLGQNAFLILSVIALFATANTVLILLIVGSRMVYGIANDGSLPRLLSTVHGKTGTPWLAILVVMLLSMFFSMLGSLEVLAGVTNFAAFTIFAIVNSSLIWLRFKRPDADRPFKVPFSIRKVPVIPLLGLISCAFLASYLDRTAVMVGMITLITGAVACQLFKPKAPKHP